MSKPLNILKIVGIFYSLLFLFCSTVYAFDYGNPTSLEQAHLEAINRARLNPLMEAQNLSINLFEGVPSGLLTSSPKQPLSFNAQLLAAARQHSLDMLNQNYFAHVNRTNQSSSNRINAIGYDYQSTAENLAMNGLNSAINDVAMVQVLHNDLFVDSDYKNRAHRTNLLNPGFREVGIGLFFGIWHSNANNFNTAMLATDFGTRNNSRPIILGVVYDDSNQNNVYDAGEGMPDVAISVAQGSNTRTASAGGYGVEVDFKREYVLTFTHPSLGSTHKTVRVEDLNIKVDVQRSEFPNANPIAQRNADQNAMLAQQCLTLNQNQLNLPCVNAAGYVYNVELEALNANMPANGGQFGIRSITQKKLSKATACELYDQHAMKAYVNCITIDNRNYRAELVMQSTAVPVFELRIFNP